jgi:hypothetical protein
LYIGQSASLFAILSDWAWTPATARPAARIAADAKRVKGCRVMESPCREELTRFKKTHKTLTVEHAEHGRYVERRNTAPRRPFVPWDKVFFVRLRHVVSS